MNQADTPTISGYTLLRVLGHGGMAVVYHATQDSLGREVALKVMSAELARDPGYSERFLREGRVVASLRHRNILMVYDLGVADGRPYLAMEFIPGGAVSDEAGRMSQRESLKVVRDIARALDHAHAQGVIHRDIKPENILRGADGDYLLADFGIARSREATSALTVEGSTLGTPQYMSPEQWRGETLDGRTDLYSLGVVLYQLLTGKLPYTGTDGWAVGMQHMTAALPALPPEYARVQPVLDMLLAKVPANRFANGAALANAAESLLASLPPLPTPRPMAAATTALPTPHPSQRPSAPQPVAGGAPPRPPQPQAPPPQRQPTPPPQQTYPPQPSYPPHQTYPSQQTYSQPQPVYAPAPPRGGPSTGVILAGIGAVVFLLLAAAGGIGWMIYKKSAATLEEAQTVLTTPDGDGTADSGDTAGGDTAGVDPLGDATLPDDTAPIADGETIGTPGNAGAADAQIKAQLDRIGLPYTIDSDNDFQIELPTRDGRTQLGWVRSPVEVYGGHRIREIWSMGYRSEGGDIPGPVANRMMEHANSQKLGGWVRQGSVGMFVVQIDAEASDGALEEAIRLGFLSADTLEQEFTGDEDAL
jgi:serine/threonine protein kinase